MKKYKLVKKSLLIGSLAMILSTTGCGEDEDYVIDNTLKNRYVVLVDGSITLVEKTKSINDCIHYIDVITNTDYTIDKNCRSDTTTYAVVDVKGPLIDFLLPEEITMIKNNDFTNENWITLYDNICTEYAPEWEVEPIRKIRKK